MNVNKERKKRQERTGKWFVAPEKDKWLWVNWIFPFALVVSLICVIIVR
jgi:hypothetical protein